MVFSQIAILAIKPYMHCTGFENLGRVYKTSVRHLLTGRVGGRGGVWECGCWCDCVRL